MGMDIGIKENDNFLLSKNYENSLDVEVKKSRGIYYTPKVVVDYIIENTLEKHDIVKNPYPRVLDISCGCGNFLLEAYDILYKMFEENIYELKQKYKSEYWKYDNIHNHIISNCIYGVDIDKNAVDILKKSLKLKDKDAAVDKFNIYCCDGLKKTWKDKFDYIIGNPPYIGHKSLDKEYKKYLQENYYEVYRDKSDVYFCFYKKIIDILSEDGICSIITPRYFLESQSGKHLRYFMKENTRIVEIVDFLGANIFKNIGVASCIITFNKENNNEVIDIFKNQDEDLEICENHSLRGVIYSNKFEHFTINSKSLGENWLIAKECDKLFYNKIESRCEYILDEVAESFQGIITGCDKAFVLDNNDERVVKIEDSILKNWVKNKNISKYIVKKSSHKLIYANDIDNEIKYDVVIKECIEKYKERLENRRECKKNIRKWYELQWGREKNLFERKKIMYPYKSKENRFAIDYDKNFSSADVYSFFIKEQYKEKFSYEYLVGILNSSVYDKYFKITAKKMSKNIYDYYPNKVMKIKIFKDDNYNEIESLSKKIINILHSEDDKDIEKIQNLQEKIDKLVTRSLGV